MEMADRAEFSRTWRELEVSVSDIWRSTVVRARSISELATSTLASTSRWVTTLIMEKPRRSTTTTDDARMEPMTRTCKDVRHCSSDVSRRRRKYSLKTVTHRILSCSPLPAQSR